MEGEDKSKAQYLAGFEPKGVLPLCQGLVTMLEKLPCFSKNFAANKSDVWMQLWFFKGGKNYNY